MRVAAEVSRKRQRMSSPRADSALTTAEPMNPLPPVTRTFTGLGLFNAHASVKIGLCRREREVSTVPSVSVSSGVLTVGKLRPGSRKIYRGQVRLWHTGSVLAASVVHSVVLFVAVITAVVFGVAFQFGLVVARQVDPRRSARVPVARLLLNGLMWRDRARERWRRAVAHGVYVLHAGCIAFAITAVFVMFLCLVGFVFLAAAA